MSGAERSNLLQLLTEKLPADVLETLQDLSTPTADDMGSQHYGTAIQTAWGRAIGEHVGDDEGERDRESFLQKLLSLDPERRHVYLDNQPRLHTISTATRLLRLCWEQRIVDPQHSEDLAKLALDVLRLVELKAAPHLIEDLQARAWACIGNARRIQSDLQGAAQALRIAEEHLQGGHQDPLEEALVEHSIGRLFQDQRRFRDAIPRLNRAARKYQQIGDTTSHLHVLITLGCTYREAGDATRGLDTLRRAEDLQPDDHPSLLYVRHNQIDCLIDLGRYEEAASLLHTTRPLYAHAPEPLARLRLPWIEGRLARHMGRFDDAEYLFQRVRQGFIEHGIAYDAAQVSLELAEIYVEQGRNEELKELAQEMVTVFRSRNVEREAIAALLMLHHAASAERATLHMIRDIADRLRERAPQAVTPLGADDA